VEFAWPDGSELDDRAEGYIDDFHPLLPTNDPALQVFYAVITEGTRLPTTAAAVLRNP
jgi:hypothetical protein